MVTLTLLPHETILEILSHLPLKQLETVAKTFNHPITDICLPLLQPLFKSRRDRKDLVRAFGEFGQRFPVPHGLESLDLDSPVRKTLGLSRRDVIKLPRRRRTLDMDFMEFHGDFDWLKPLPKSVSDDMAGHYRGPALIGTALDDLLSSAERVGVTIPPAFLKFMQNEELQLRIPSHHAGAFHLTSGGLLRIPKARIGGRVGYAIGFLSYLIDGVMLYLEPGKDGICSVLTDMEDECPYEVDGVNVPHEEEDCPYVTQEDRDDSKAQKVEILAHGCTLELVGMDFETYLANLYYSEVLYWVCRLEAEPVPGLVEYVKYMLVERREIPKKPKEIEDLTEDARRQTIADLLQ
ncbi:unnamed protein product [Clonostachys rhizophaga]|uniref:F-box domain-containing protein n=1 Tax=Clonostachys rhizophaga TaxID=160324 RepID=A0A9N9VHR5_9HYPO|nr:unnamed protein product [Clonostachys rhizophaga]